MQSSRHCEQFSMISSRASVMSARAVKDNRSRSGEEREKDLSAPPAHRSPAVRVADLKAVVAADWTLEIPNRR